MPQVVGWPLTEGAASGGDYVRQLLKLCEQHAHADQQSQFNEVLRHERDFWQMIWEA